MRLRQLSPEACGLLLHVLRNRLQVIAGQAALIRLDEDVAKAFVRALEILNAVKSLDAEITALLGEKGTQ